MTAPFSDTAVPILYTNYRGETGVRRIVPGPLWFGSTEWHPEPQWLLTADEPDTGKRRDFALSGIIAWGADRGGSATHPPPENEKAPHGGAGGAQGLVREENTEDPRARGWFGYSAPDLLAGPL